MKNKEKHRKPHDAYVFEQTALNGEVPDKDGVRDALKGLHNVYQRLGVGRKTRKRIVEELDKEFQGADRIQQPKIGRRIIATHRTIAEATRRRR
ncbi:MAG: hypothetical protein UT63_C0017G0016 [Candidatus Gottesmanbacteria bacterium GW2011_GWC2_39_8]|uniref:Uncharacterized protein n=1 Tax=Candidatus Gottesmanbacteria bacterium GW2011_GWC2_39_8 TaxID=1618450 RepID=A0A0G0SFD9_9BACT|nr:MAG: hypothetical protein UT63_C0017G0016 [Candidatus Gottesmanbacteria bacterium GW2011_GWC2_39_8]